MRRSALAMGVLLLSAFLSTSRGLADMPRDNFPAVVPPPPVAQPAPGPLAKTTVVRVEISNKGEQTRLLIPRKLLTQLQTAAVPAVPREDGALLSWSANMGIGLSLVGALTLGGFCFIRKPRPALVRGLAVAALLLTLTGVVSIALATPPKPNWQPGPGPGAPPVLPAIPGFTLAGAMAVEVVEEGEGVRLILHKDTPLQYVGRPRGK